MPNKSVEKQFQAELDKIIQAKKQDVVIPEQPVVTTKAERVAQEVSKIHGNNRIQQSGAFRA